MRVNYIAYVGMAKQQQIQVNISNNGDALLTYLLKKNNFTMEDLRGISRKKEIVLTRYIYWYLHTNLYKKTKKAMSTTKLGAIFNRDHCTVMFGIKTIRGRVEYELKFAKYINGLYEKFERIKNKKLYEL